MLLPTHSVVPFPPPPDRSAVPALRLAGVVRRFPRFTFGPMDLEVPAGAVVGLLGTNGAGKSTLLRLLLGLLHADAGSIEILGRPMPAEESEIKRRVAFVSEDMALYGAATVAWHLRFVRGLAPAWDGVYADELLRRFALLPEQRVRGLSRGQTVRLMLLLALVRRPELLLLDEPTTGLDPRVRREVRNELAALSRREGTTIVFSSHLTEDVEALADEVVMIDAGRLVRRAPTATLLGEGPLEQVFLRAIASPSSSPTSGQLREVSA